MNERIGKLLNRSGGEFYEGFAGSPNTIKFTEEELETFVGLIVRECAKVADDGFASSNFGNGITGHQLLKHFGVEE